MADEKKKKQDSPQDQLDKEVLELLKNEDPNAAARLIDVFGDRVYGLSLRILNSEEDAKECVQETFLTVWRKWDTFKGKSKFSSWIYRIAANQAYMKLRSRRKRSQEMSLEQLDEMSRDRQGSIIDRQPSTILTRRSASPDDALLRSEKKALIHEAIASLSETYRTAYTLKEIDGLSLRAIAEVMDLSEPAVKSRVHRARLEVRKKLEPYLDD